MSQDSTCRCTGYGMSRIFCGPALPDANGVIATPAHYASGDNTNDAIHRMQRAISFQTVCVGRQESSASKNAKQVSMQASSPIGLDEKITTPPNDVHPVAPAGSGCGQLGAQRVSESESASHAVEEAHARLACSPARHSAAPSCSSTRSNSNVKVVALGDARRSLATIGSA